jgi:outer membrane protein assembly factor BamA
MKFNQYANKMISAAVLCCALFAVSDATAAEAVLVQKLVVQGNQRIESDAILRVVKTKAGDPYNPGLLSEDLQSIYAMGWFDDVRVEVEKQAMGNTVILSSRRKPPSGKSKFQAMMK